MLELKEMEAIIDLDKRNMQPVLEKYSIVFDPNKRRTGLEKEIKDGAKFVYIKRNNMIIAYLEYIILKDQSCTVPSIQIHPEYQNGFTLVRLLTKVYKELHRNCPTYILSSVHKENMPSLNLHSKLGFKSIKENNQRIEFQISGEEFLERIKFVTKRKNLINH